MKRSMYCAMIADIRDSKKMDIKQRKNVQEKLKLTLETFNKAHKKKLATSLDFSRGDQIQALFYSPLDAYDFACMFRAELFPVRFRIGLGVGDWAIKVKGGNSNAQDGTSYHNAAKAFEKAHAEEKGMAFFSGEEADAILNVLMTNEDRIFNCQTNLQKEIAKQCTLSEPIAPEMKRDAFGINTVFYKKGSQKWIAEHMKTSRQNISQQIKRGKIYEQRELKAAVAILLQQHCNEKGRWQR